MLREEKGDGRVSGNGFRSGCGPFALDVMLWFGCGHERGAEGANAGEIGFGDHLLVGLHAVHREIHV